MFTTQARIIVGLLFLSMAIFFIYHQSYRLAAVAFLLVGIIVWGYFKEGTLVLAAKHFHKKDYDKAGQLLNQIKQPAYLSKKRRGFYEFMMGSIHLQYKDYEKAEKHFEQASQYPLRTANDHVATLVHVATISYRNGNIEKAKAYLLLAEKHRDNITAKMKEVLTTLDKELKKK